MFKVMILAGGKWIDLTPPVNKDVATFVFSQISVNILSAQVVKCD